MSEWKKILLEKAKKAKAENRLVDYASFIEALLPVTYKSEQREVWERELYEFYLKAEEWKKVILFANSLANPKEFHESGNRLLHAYKLSISRKYKKGVLFTLLGFGKLLEEKDPIMACQFIYKAKLIGEEIHSIFYITARDLLTNMDIHESKYHTSLTTGELVSKFKKIYS